MMFRGEGGILVAGRMVSRTWVMSWLGSVVMSRGRGQRGVVGIAGHRMVNISGVQARREVDRGGGGGGLDRGGGGRGGRR